MLAAGAESGGLVYVIGGLNPTTGTALASVDIYDPVTNSWSAGTPMPTARWSLAATSMGGKIYVVGGFVPGVGTVGTVEVYDPASPRQSARRWFDCTATA